MNLCGFPYDRARFSIPCFSEILLDLSLSVNKYVSASQCLQVDPVVLLTEGELKSFMDQAVAHHAGANPCLLQ